MAGGVPGDNLMIIIIIIIIMTQPIPRCGRVPCHIISTLSPYIIIYDTLMLIDKYIFQISPTHRSSTRSRSSYNPHPVPILNTRMKNLSQFSFKYREDLSQQHPNLSNQARNTTHYKSFTGKKKACLQVTLFSMFIISLILVLALVLSSPQVRIKAIE